VRIVNEPFADRRLVHGAAGVDGIEGSGKDIAVEDVVEGAEPDEIDGEGERQRGEDDRGERAQTITLAGVARGIAREDREAGRHARIL
jgi:hypothetical protein